MARGNPYKSLKTAFEAGNFEPLYLVYGEERWFIDELQRILVEKGVQPHERDFNLDILYGADVDAKSALGICQSYPMMAERRVVVIRDFDRIRDNSIFKSYAEQPNPQAVVFLVCSGKPRFNSHPYLAIRKHGKAIEFEALYSNQVPRWIETLAKERGMRMKPRAVQMLSDFVGSKLSNVATELDKLSTFAGGREEVTEDDVVQATGQTREFNVFELQRAVGETSYNDAIRISERLLQQSSNERGECLKIIAVLTSFFVRLWQLSGLQMRRIPEKEMAKAIGVSPYFLKEYLGSLQRFDRAALDRAISSLLAADYELKGGSARSERLIMSLLFHRMLLPKAHITGRSA